MSEVSVGDQLILVQRVSPRTGDIRSIETVTVGKVYKTGKFVLDGDDTNQQWRRGRYGRKGWEETGEKYYRTKSLHPLKTLDEFKQIFFGQQALARRRKVSQYLSERLEMNRRSEPLSADKLARINAILNEPEEPND